MYTIHFNTATHGDSRPMNTLWAANLIAQKYVNEWGWDRALVINNETGEVLREYHKD